MYYIITFVKIKNSFFIKKPYHIINLQSVDTRTTLRISRFNYSVHNRICLALNKFYVKIKMVYNNLLIKEIIKLNSNKP